MNDSTVGRDVQVQSERMRKSRALLVLGGVLLIAAAFAPGTTSAGTGDVVLVTTVTPTPTPKLYFGLPNHRSGTPTPTAKP